MSYGRSKPANCFIVLIVLLALSTMPEAMSADAQAEYDAVHKALPESTGSQSMAVLRKYTNEPPRLMYLTEQLPPTFFWHALERATLRLEIIKDNEGVQFYESCTATLISPNQVITAAHCIPGNGPGVVIKAKVVSYHSTRGVLAKADVELASAPLLLSTPEDISILALSISYPLGQSKRLSSGNCRVGNEHSPIASQFYHFCMTFPASSGALVVARSDGAVVGVHAEAQDNASIANTLVGVKGLASFKAEVVAAPEAVDTSGWSLAPSMLKSGFAAAVAKGNAKSWLDTMMNEKSDMNALNAELQLVGTAVELNSVETVTLLKERGLGLSASQAGHYLNNKVYGPWSDAKREILGYLLAQHAEVGLNPATGLPIYCGPDVLGAVKQVFSENGYGQQNCHH